MKSRQKLADIDGNTHRVLRRESFLTWSIVLDTHDRFFEQENNVGYFTADIDHQAASIRRRVSSMFGDTNSNVHYFEPQKITDETLLDVRIPRLQKKERELLLLPSCRTNITTPWANWNSSFNWWTTY